MGDDEHIDPGATMQVDAIIEDYEESELPRTSGPPPLPPKKPSKLAYVAGAIVVVLMAGLGIVAGLFAFGYIGGEPEVAQPARVQPPPPPAEPPPPSNVVQMEDVVFGAEDPPPPQ